MAIKVKQLDLSDVFAFTAVPTINADPSGDNDVPRKSWVVSQIAAVASGLAPKDSVRAATTEAVTLASDLENGDVIDGVTLATGDRILVKNQASGIENGIYVVAASGAPARAADLPTGASAAGANCYVEEGTANADKPFVCTTNKGSDIVGTDSLTFSVSSLGADANAFHGNETAEFTALTAKTTPVDADVTVIEDSEASSAKKKLAMSDLRTYVRTTAVQEQITAEAISGTDTALTDTLSYTPVSNASVRLYLNSVLLQQGVGKDYTLSGTEVTILQATGTAPVIEIDDVLIACYEK